MRLKINKELEKGENGLVIPKLLVQNTQDFKNLVKDTNPKLESVR